LNFQLERVLLESTRFLVVGGSSEGLAATGEDDADEEEDIDAADVHAAILPLILPPKFLFGVWSPSLLYPTSLLPIRRTIWRPIPPEPGCGTARFGLSGMGIE
jgi:hypothetical protein